MRYYWPKKSILELFNEADEKGTVSVELPSNYEAESFRFALYHFRRRNKNGSKFISFQISIDGTKLTIFKPVEIEIKRTA